MGFPGMGILHQIAKNLMIYLLKPVWGYAWKTNFHTVGGSTGFWSFRGENNLTQQGGHGWRQ